jgi:hypothetical protein
VIPFTLFPPRNFKVITMMNQFAAVLLLLAAQTAVAAENWTVLGYKAQGKFSLDTASVAPNKNVRMNGDIRQARVKIEWSDTRGGYDQLDSTLLFDCDHQFYADGEDTFRLKGEIVNYVLYEDFDLLKVSAEVTIKAWEKVCGKTFDRTDLAPPDAPNNKNMI